MFGCRLSLRWLTGLTVCLLIWQIYIMEPSLIPRKAGFLNLEFQFDEVNQYQQQEQQRQEEEEAKDAIEENKQLKEEQQLEAEQQLEEEEQRLEEEQKLEEEQQQEQMQKEKKYQEEQQQQLSLSSLTTNVDTHISGKNTISRSHHSTQLSGTNENKTTIINPINNTIYYTSSYLTNSSYNLSLVSYPYSVVNYEILPKDDFGKLIDIHNFEYIINQKSCPAISLPPSASTLSPGINNISKEITDTGSPILLIFVHSAPGNFKQRLLIRETWGSPANKTDKIRLLFLIGSVTKTVDQENLEKENQIYSDIVQGNFNDDYRNMTYKHVMALKWFTYFCPNAKYVLKMDDDMFANTPKLVDYLSTVADRQNLLFCQPKYDAPVGRNQTQWSVTQEEYSGDFYPPYCPGYSILYSSDVAFRLYLEAQKTRFFWIDDVHVTGILAQQANITITSAIPYILYSEELKDIVNGKIDINSSKFLFSYVYIDNEAISKLWKKVENSGHPLLANFSKIVSNKEHA